MSEMQADIYLAYDSSTDRIPVFTALTLFIYKFCKSRGIKIHLIHDLTQAAIVECEYNCLLSEHQEIDIQCEEQVPAAVKYCTLPVALCDQGRLVIAGLSSILRLIVLHAHQSNDVNNASHVTAIGSLLGEKSNCLKACAEVSPWTKFCEIALPSVVEKFVVGSADTDIPKEIIQLEIHLEEISAQKCRTHCQSAPTQKPPCTFVGNEQDFFIRESSRSDGNSDKGDQPAVSMLTKTNCDELPFLEGGHLQLTDLILFLCLGLCFCKSTSFQQSCAGLYHVCRWFKVVNSIKFIHDAVKATGLPSFEFELTYNDTLACFNSKNASSGRPEADDNNSISNKSTDRTCDSVDSFRVETKAKFKASQFAITGVLQKLLEIGIEPCTVLLNSSTSLPWTDYPDCVLPSTHIGGVPDKRASRKLEQLENMVAAVMSIVQLRQKESYAIVDFCSGGGHLGIILAYLLPRCQVVLVENKEQSLKRALSRVDSLGLKNVTAVQCNLSCFNMIFDIGICLHACGVATDLVMSQCIKCRASFVVCPCCYGAVRSSQIIQYPRSQQFTEAGITDTDCMVLGHAADQTQTSIPKETQGRTCMSYIDSDRASMAIERGYRVSLCRMNPPSCSPKNHILIGICS